jgi:hypothetical protein
MRRPHIFQCQSQKCENGENGDAVHLQPMAYKGHTNIIKDNEPDLMEPQSLRDNMQVVAQGLETRCSMMEMRIMSAYIRPSWESDRTAPSQPKLLL